MKSTKYCEGCKDDFYNGNNGLGVKECWHLEDAKIVTRYKLGWWTAPTKLSVFHKVKTYNCHYAPGEYVFYERIPEHLK